MITDIDELRKWSAWRGWKPGILLQTIHNYEIYYYINSDGYGRFEVVRIHPFEAIRRGAKILTGIDTKKDIRDVFELEVMFYEQGGLNLNPELKIFEDRELNITIYVNIDLTAHDVNSDKKYSYSFNHDSELIESNSSLYLLLLRIEKYCKEELL